MPKARLGTERLTRLSHALLNTRHGVSVDDLPTQSLSFKANTLTGQTPAAGEFNSLRQATSTLF